MGRRGRVEVDQMNRVTVRGLKTLRGSNLLQGIGQERILPLAFIILAAASICIGVLGGFWEIKLGWSGSDEINEAHYNYLLFTGSFSRQIIVNDGRFLILYYDVVVDRGSLTISVVKVPGQTLWSQRFDENSSGSIRIALNGRGVYSIVVRGRGARGGFDLRWEVG